MPLFFTTLASDSLDGANEVPLNPTKWSLIGGQFPLAPLQILSNTCRATSTQATDNRELYTGVSWPNDQWAEVKLVHNEVGNESEFYISLRTSDDGGTGYNLFLLDATDGTLVCGLEGFSNFQTLPGNPFFRNDSLPYQDGDVFRFAMLGNQLLAYQNGNLIALATDSSISSGKVGVSIEAITALDDVQLSNFAGGLVSVSPPFTSSGSLVGFGFGV